METIIKPIWDRKVVKMSGYNLFSKINFQVFDTNGEITDCNELTIPLGDVSFSLEHAVTIVDGGEAHVYFFFQNTDNRTYSVL